MSEDTRRARRPRSLVVAAAVAVGLSAPLAAAGTASAAEEDLTNGHLDWGFKESFRNYVSGGNGSPPIAAGDGATLNGDGTFHFPVSGGTYDPESGASTVHHGGTVTFSYPAHFFTLTLANPTIVVDGSNGTLLADVDLVSTLPAVPPVSADQVPMAELGVAGGPAVDGETVTWTGVAAAITAEGAAVFGSFGYPEGTALDPASFTFAYGDGTVDPGPTGPTAEQEITVDLAGGPLSLSVAGTSVALTTSTGDQYQVATGLLNTATVSDLRATNAGWTLVGQVEDFTSQTDGVIPGSNLGWQPTASVVDDGLGGGTPAAVNPGAAVDPGAGLGTAKTLCAADPGGSAGTFECGAELTLGIPASTVPGAYAATLTLTLS